jgi:hypothetical protein
MPFGAARLAFLAKTSLTVEAVVYRSEVKITPVNTAQVDTANSKFGGASYLGDRATLSYLDLNDTIIPATGPFTIECWVNLDIVDSNSQMVSQYNSSEAGRLVFGLVNSNFRLFAGSNLVIGTTTVVTDTWYHVAVVRDSSNEFRLYVNGVEEDSTTSSVTISTVASTLIGRFRSGTSRYLDGHIDEVRISDIARYTADFTPQTQPHQNDDNTLLLMHMDGKDADKGFVDDPGYDLLLDTVVFESETTALGTSAHNDWHWKSDGTSFHAVDRSADAVYNYSLTTAFDASTATRGTSKSISSFDINARGIALNPEGTIMIVCGDGNNKLFEFDLSTAFDVTSWSSSSDDFTLNGSNLTSRGILWNDDGTELYVLNSGTTQIFAYTTTTPYSLSGMSFNTSVSHTLDNNSVIAMNWANSGYTLLVTNDSTDDLYSFRCDTPYDATTSEFRAQISMNSPSSAGVQVDETNQKILVYDISDDDISTYSYG